MIELVGYLAIACVMAALGLFLAAVMFGRNWR